MLTILAYFVALAAVILLIKLSVVDWRERILPNEMVLGLATLGFVFHAVTTLHYLDADEIIVGAVFGYASLYLIRAIANRLYGFDTLGLGDVKLMGAIGLWLGLQGVLLVMMAGSVMSAVLGLIIKDENQNGTHRFSAQIPAGPGFAAAAVAVGVWMFAL